MGALSTANALNEMEAQQWFVVLSNLIFLVTSWMCLKRYQWIRAAAFLFVCVSSTWYHLEVDTQVLDPTESGYDADRIAAFYAVMSMILLFAHIPSQSVEMIIELLLMCFVVAMVLLRSEFEDWLVALSGALLTLVVSIPTWVVYGPTPSRYPWLVAACLFATGAIIIRMIEEDDDMWLHGFWHIQTGLAALCAVYALRDPHLLNNYAILADIK
jgi:hypothetical protein